MSINFLNKNTSFKRWFLYFYLPIEAAKLLYTRNIPTITKSEQITTSVISFALVILVVFLAEVRVVAFLAGINLLITVMLNYKL
jgi:hypothetical protein